MAIVRDNDDGGKPYTCLDTDLVAGFPPLGTHKANDTMEVYDVADLLVNVFVVKDVGVGLVWKQII